MSREGGKCSVADLDQFGPDPDPTYEDIPDSDPDPVKTGSGFIYVKCIW